MGLNVVVGAFLDNEDPEGIEDLQAELAAVNEALREAGLPEHHEPERADWDPVDFDMWGYGGLHYLRRVAAHLDRGEGFYVPIPFSEVLISEDVAGGMIGSSQALLAELTRVARALGLPPELDPASDEAFEAAENQGRGESWKAYGVESLTCLQLQAAARASVERQAAIVFA